MKKILNFVLVFFFLLTFQSFASNRLSWPGIKTDLVFDKSIETGTLENGFRYLIKKNNTPKKRAAAYLGIMAGSLFENENEKGVAHYLEHMVFNGSKNFKPGELVKYFQRIGMDFGADTNAHTGFDETVYKIYLPDGSKKEIENAFTVLKDFAVYADLPQAEVERERGVILAEKNARDSVSFRTTLKEYAFLFKGTIIADRFPIGEEEIIKNTDSKLLRHFYKSFYTPDRMVLVVTGDVDVENTKKLIKKFFSDIKKEKTDHKIPDPGKVVKRDTRDVFYHHEKEAGSVKISVNVVLNEGSENDSIDYQMKWLKRYMASRALNNRLNALLEQDDTPFISASTFSFPFLRKILWARTGVKTDTKNYEKSLELLIDELRKANEFGFSDDEVLRVKNDILNMLKRGVEKVNTRDTKSLASSMISSAMDGEIIVSPEDEKKIYFKRVKDLKKEDINKAFKDIFNREDLLISVTGNLDLGKNGEKIILKKADLFFSKEIKKDLKKDTKKFPYLFPLEKKSKIKESKLFKDLDIKRIVLENNIVLNYKKTDFKENTISLRASFGKGSAFLPDARPGLSYLTSSVLNISRLESISADELRSNLSGKSVRAHYGVGKESFYISGSSSKTDLETLFSLVYHYLKDPGAKKSAYKLALERVKSSYEKDIKSVDGVFHLKAPLFFSGNDKRFISPSPDDASKISLNEIKGFIKSNFENSGIEISIAGDFNEKKLENLFLKYFVSFEKRDELKKEIPKGINFPIAEEEIETVDTKIKSAYVLAGIKTDDIYPIEQARVLNLTARIIEDRLRENIREKLGAAYSPFAYHNPGSVYKNYGGMFLGVKTVPEKIDVVKAEIKEIINDLGREPVSNDEFERAFNPLINHITTYRQKNGYWLNTVLNGSFLNPVKFEWAKTLVSGYENITKEMVEKEIKKYLRTEKISFLIVKSK